MRFWIESVTIVEYDGELWNCAVDGAYVVSYVYILSLQCLTAFCLLPIAAEVLANQSYTTTADVYSYGIILWELLTAKCPYESMTPIQCALAVLNKNQRPEIPPWCPPALHALIRKCVKKEPTERPSFEDILELLDQMPQGTTA